MTNDDRRDVPLGFVLRLLDVLAEMEQRDKRRRRGRGRLGDNVTYGYDVSIGLESVPERTDAMGLVTTRSTEDGRVVVADLPGVDPAAVDIHVDRESGTLHLRIDGEPVERVPLLDGDAEVAESSVTNGILEVRLR